MNTLGAYGMAKREIGRLLVIEEKGGTGDTLYIVYVCVYGVFINAAKINVDNIIRG